MKWVCCFLACFSVVYGDTQSNRQAQAKLATLLVDAQQYDAARAIYETLLNSSPQPWEKSILHYNLGVIAITEQRWSQAIREFKAADLAQNTPTWLLGRLETNRAMALIGHIQELLTHILPKATQPNVVLDQLQQLVIQAETALTKAEFLNCQAPQSNACATPQDLMEFHLKLKDLDADIESQFDALRISYLPPVDLVGALIASLKSDRQQINVIDESNLKAFLAIRAAQRIPYWNALEAQYPFTAGMVEAVQPPESRTAATAALEHAINALNRLFVELFSAQEPFVQDLARLRLDYAEALGAELSLRDLQAIQQRYRQLIHRASSTTAERLVQAREIHQAGIQALLEDEPFVARLYFTVAARWIDLAMLPLQSKTPSEWLEWMITLQESNHSVTRNMQLLLSSSGGFGTSMPLMLTQLQKVSLGLNDLFLGAVIQQENKRYAEGECQDSPWNRGLPDFFEGDAAATQAMHALDTNPVDWTQVRENQQQAISLWRRALQKLRESKRSDETRVAQPEEFMSKTPPSKQLPLSETIRYLQQMESDDRPQKAAPSQESGVLRPW